MYIISENIWIPFVFERRSRRQTHVRCHWNSVWCIREADAFGNLFSEEIVGMRDLPVPWVDPGRFFRVVVDKVDLPVVVLSIVPSFRQRYLTISFSRHISLFNPWKTTTTGTRTTNYTAILHTTLSWAVAFGDVTPQRPMTALSLGQRNAARVTNIL